MYGNRSSSDLPELLELPPSWDQCDTGSICHLLQASISKVQHALHGVKCGCQHKDYSGSNFEKFSGIDSNQAV
jgi:hypothetical protein